MGWSNQAIELLVIEEETSGFSGLFGYAPTVGPGNLVLSISAAGEGGTDPYGNVYLFGTVTYGQISGGQWVAEQMSVDVLGAGLQFWTAPGYGGPWTAGPFVGLGDDPATDMDIFAPGTLRFASSEQLTWTDPAGDSWAVGSKVPVGTTAQDIGSTSLTPVTGLQADLQPGTYRLSLRLWGLCSTVAGTTYSPGFVFSGTADAIDLNATNWLSTGEGDAPVATNDFGVISLSGLGASPPAPGTTSRSAWTEVDGIVTVTAGGTLQGAAASSTSGDNYHLFAGCLMEVLPIV